MQHWYYEGDKTKAIFSEDSFVCLERYEEGFVLNGFAEKHYKHYVFKFFLLGKWTKQYSII